MRFAGFFCILTALLCSHPLVLAQPDPSFFPIGVWLQQTSNAKAYKKMGVNLYVGLWEELNNKQWNELQEAGMKLMCSQNSFGLSLGNNPMLYGWTLGDEPDNAQMNEATGRYDPCINPEIIDNQYRSLKQKDPSRPVYLNLGQGVAYTRYIGRGACSGNTAMYPEYIKGADIVSFDIYPVNNTDKTSGGNLWYVAKGIDSLRVWSDYKKPVWCWIETSKIGKDSSRKPTPAEVKAEVWMALIHGASGFGYFCHSFMDPMIDAAPLRDPEMGEAIAGINQQITELAPVLNSPTTLGVASVQVVPSDIPVDIMTKQSGKDTYIFAVAMRPAHCTVTFYTKSGKLAEVLGENRTIPIRKNQFTDTFPSYGVRLYRIE